MGRLIDADNIEYYLEEGGSVVAFKADIDQIPTADTDSAYAEGWTAAESKYRAMMSDGDCISRQAAIDACLKGKTDGLPATNVACDCCAERIRVLPSAQPEIIRCKNCTWWSNDEYRECSSPNYDNVHVTPAGFYCGWAERRTDA